MSTRTDEPAGAVGEVGDAGPRWQEAARSPIKQTLTTEDTEDTEPFFQLLWLANVAFSSTGFLGFEPVFVAQLLTYLRITGLRRGLF